MKQKKLKLGNRIVQSPFQGSFQLSTAIRHPGFKLSLLYGSTLVTCFMVFGYKLGRDWGVDFYKSTPQGQLDMLTDEEVKFIFEIPFMLLCGFGSASLGARAVFHVKDKGYRLWSHFHKQGSEETQPLHSNTTVQTKDDQEDIEKGVGGDPLQSSSIKVSSASLLTYIASGLNRLIKDLGNAALMPISLILFAMMVQLNQFVPEGVEINEKVYDLLLAYLVYHLNDNYIETVKYLESDTAIVDENNDHFPQLEYMSKNCCS